MADIALRGELWDNDSADVLRWWGWRDVTAPMDIQAALEAAGGEEVTLLINSPGGDMSVGGCDVIQSEPGALLCYHNPSGAAAGDHREMERSAEALRNARDCILEMYEARGSARSREELIALMDRDIWITPTQALEYGLIDEVAGLAEPEGDVAAFVAAAGGRIRLTEAMRRKYRDHIAAERETSEQKEQARRALAKIRALASY